MDEVVPTNGEVQPVQQQDVDMEEADWSDSQRGDDEQQEKKNGTEAVSTEPEVTVKAEKVDMKLADLFADMDSDEEFPSSNNIKSSPPQPSSPPM